MNYELKSTIRLNWDDLEIADHPQKLQRSRALQKTEISIPVPNERGNRNPTLDRVRVKVDAEGAAIITAVWGNYNPTTGWLTPTCATQRVAVNVESPEFVEFRPEQWGLIPVRHAMQA